MTAETYVVLLLPVLLGIGALAVGRLELWRTRRDRKSAEKRLTGSDAKFSPPGIFSGALPAHVYGIVSAPQGVITPSGLVWDEVTFSEAVKPTVPMGEKTASYGTDKADAIDAVIGRARAAGSATAATRDVGIVDLEFSRLDGKQVLEVLRARKASGGTPNPITLLRAYVAQNRAEEAMVTAEALAKISETLHPEAGPVDDKIRQALAALERALGESGRLRDKAQRTTE